MHETDVLVVGGGVAAACAAMAGVVGKPVTTAPRPALAGFPGSAGTGGLTISLGATTGGGSRAADRVDASAGVAGADTDGAALRATAAPDPAA